LANKTRGTIEVLGLCRFATYVPPAVFAGVQPPVPSTLHPKWMAIRPLARDTNILASARLPALWRSDIQHVRSGVLQNVCDFRCPLTKTFACEFPVSEAQNVIALEPADNAATQDDDQKEDADSQPHVPAAIYALGKQLVHIADLCHP
jgi:hypothetical protein